jgi:hypothetical protein
MKRAITALFLAGFLASVSAAQEKFTIKIKNDSKGDVTRASDTGTETGKMSFSVGGKSQAKDEDKKKSMVFKEEILEKEPGKRAAKMQRTYEKAEMTANGKKITPSFIGKPMLIERAGKEYHFTVAGKKLEGDDLAFMKEEFKEKEKDAESKLEQLMLPKQPVAVNETWKLDVAALQKEFGEDSGMTIDLAKSTGAGKLIKAYKKDGKQFGAMEYDITMALTKIAAGPGMAIELDNTSSLKMTIKFDGCIDGSLNTGVMDMKMEMKMVGALNANGVEVKVDAKMTKSDSRTQEDLTGKK